MKRILLTAARSVIFISFLIIGFRPIVVLSQSAWEDEANIRETTSQASISFIIPSWDAFEKALSGALLPSADPTKIEEGLCEWTILGNGEQEVYVWALCQVAGSTTGAAASVPAAIYLSSDGKIERVDIPGDGIDYAPAVRELFPFDVQDKINHIDLYFDVKAAMEHIDSRRKDKSIPPIIVEKR